MMDQAMDEELSPGKRLRRAHKLMEAIADCEWEDAELVMSTILFAFRGGSPQPPFGAYEDEAAFWASIATFDELLAYFIECGKKLVRRRLGTRGRIRMIETIINDLPPEEVQKVVDRMKGTHPEQVA